MPDRISSFIAPCGGGLITNLDPLTQGSSAPGSAFRMINYEPSLQGGYRRIDGYTNDYGTVPGESGTAVLGVAVFGQLNNGIFACRKPASGNNYFHYWNSSTSAWVTPTTSGSPTMTGVSRVRFSKVNWGAPKLILVDGINPPATWDGTTYTQLTTGTIPSAPSYCEDFASHLFLAGDPDEQNLLYFSAPLDETNWTPAAGAGVINVGFEITQIKSFRDQLYIFGVNEIKRLTGNSIADFQLLEVTKNLGCVSPDSVVEFNGDLLFLSPDGIRPVSATDRIGDLEINTLSKSVQDIFETLTENENLETVSVVVLNKKSQFRLFFADADALGVIGALRKSIQSSSSFEYSQLIGMEVNCVDSGYVGTEEFIVHGDSTGRVFRQESGNNFNGEPIFSLYQTPYVYMDDPLLRKVFYDVNTYLKAEGEVTVSLGIKYDYNDSEKLVPVDYNFTTTGSASFWGSATYDSTDIYDGNPSPVKKTNIEGSGDSVSLSYVTVDDQPSHTIQAYVISYTIADRR